MTDSTKIESLNDTTKFKKYVLWFRFVHNANLSTNIERYYNMYKYI